MGVLMSIVLGISGIGFCFSATYVVCDALHDQCFPVTTISDARKRWQTTADASNSENEGTSKPEIVFLEPSLTISNGMAHDETDLRIDSMDRLDGRSSKDDSNSSRSLPFSSARRRLGTGNISPVLIELAE